MRRKWPSYVHNWERARAIYPRNQIVSSDWGPKGRKCHFHPSYNCEPRPDMTKLVTMEYARMWETEREKWRESIKITTMEQRERKQQR